MDLNRLKPQPGRSRFVVDRQKGFDLAAAFFAASRSGDLTALKTMLADDVTLTGDGGGKRPAGMAPYSGFDIVLSVLERVAKLAFSDRPSELVRYAYINGLPGFVTREADGLLQTTALHIRDVHVDGIYVMRNPDKLRHLEASLN